MMQMVLNDRSQGYEVPVSFAILFTGSWYSLANPREGRRFSPSRRAVEVERRIHSLNENGKI